MGKSSKKAAAAVAAPTPVPKGKGGKKREAEDEIEKAVSAKKQKAAAPPKAVPPPKEDGKKAKKQPPPKKIESSSSEEEESESESEEEVKVQTKKAAKPVKQEPSDDSSDETSESDEEPAKKPAAKLPAPAAKKGKQESSSSEDESDDDDKPAAPLKKPSVTGAQKKKEESESSDSDSDDESDEEVALKSKAPVPASKKEDSDESESESDSEDEDKTAKAAQPAKRPASAAASKRKDESSDSSDSDESDEEPPQKKQKDTAPSAAVKAASAAKTESSSDDEDDSAEESSDDEPKTSQPKKAPKASTSSGSDEEDSDEDSDEEDEEPAKTPKKPKTPMGTQSEETGSKTLFMGNIPFRADFDLVKEFFQEAGEVVDVRFASNEDGSLKGFGHVEFASAEAAKKALEFNGQELMGRPLRLDLARERGAFTPRSGNDNGSFQKPARGSSHSVFIRGFDKSLAEDKIRSSLEQHFSDCGEITRVSVPMDYDTGASKGIAYLDFKDQDSLSKALGLSGSDLGGCELYVDEAKPKPPCSVHLSAAGRPSCSGQRRCPPLHRLPRSGHRSISGQPPLDLGAGVVSPSDHRASRGAISSDPDMEPSMQTRATNRVAFFLLTLEHKEEGRALIQPDVGQPLLFSIWTLIWIEVLVTGYIEFQRNAELDSEKRLYTRSSYFDPLGLAADPEKKERLQSAEIKHARLAIVAFLGFAVQAGVTGKGPLNNWATHLGDPLHTTGKGRLERGEKEEHGAVVQARRAGE